MPIKFKLRAGSRFGERKTQMQSFTSGAAFLNFGHSFMNR